MAYFYHFSDFSIFFSLIFFENTFLNLENMGPSIQAGLSSATTKRLRY